MTKRPKTVKQQFAGTHPATVGFQQAVQDIAFLIKQFHTIEHMQDREGVRAIAKRYGIKELP